MQLVCWSDGAAARAGLLVGGMVYDLAAATGRESLATMAAVLADWPAAEAAISSVDQGALSGGKALATVKLLAPIARPGTIFCAGANFRDHTAEMAAAQGRPTPPDPRTRGEKPWHFIKASQCVADPGATITLPFDSQKVDWEVELAVIIGKECRSATPETALDFVLGYTAANDLSARDLSRRNAPETSPFRFDWTSHKSFDGSLPLGPAITLAKDIPDPQALKMQLSVNGELKQNSTSAEMTFSIIEQIVYLSRSLTLMPGDVILTGTPAGVGSASGVFLRDGDVVELSIEMIGTLTNYVKEDAATSKVL